MSLRAPTLLCLTLLLCTGVRAQGPIGGFPTPKGETVIALSYSAEKYDTYLLPDNASEARDIETISYSLFAEVGVSKNSSLIATLPYMITNGRDGSLQDASVWIKYMNLDKRGDRFASRFFTAVGLSFPIGNYEVTGVEAIGQRATVFQGRLAYQFQHDDGWFLHAQSGIDFQFAPETRSAWPLLFRTGYGGRYFYVESWLEFITSLESGPDIQTAAAGTGSSWQRAGITAYVPIKPWLGIVGGGAWVLGGDFIGESGRLNAGVIFKLGVE
ncbi:transporter [Neolewinella antarctica]|uniref:Transporter n=1 Tax=Neolewinella antarctica TaxID=442734 RepID=A0ABX0X9G0_9BACT|nr:transporter [Neolewinella antarctica]NJC25822.1 hypothetical protein [Neolewinella antarctica]